MAAPAFPDVDRLLRETLVASVEHHLQIGSTNDRARQVAGESSAGLPRLIVADEQTAGRGRGVKRWWSGSEGLTFTLLADLRQFDITPERSTMVGIAAGIAVAEAVAPLVGHHPSGIHWPNDVYAGGRKLSGILVERFGGLHAIGIGLNVNDRMTDAPAELQAKIVALHELADQKLDRGEVLLAILKRLGDWLARLGAAPDEVGRRACALCLQIGRRLVLDVAGRQVAGRCLEIAADGGLVLDTPQGRNTFYSGSVAPEADAGRDDRPAG